MINLTKLLWYMMIINWTVGEWNDWRRRFPKTMPDLQGANLRGANLWGANLRGADLQGVNLLLDLGQEIRGYRRIVFLGTADGNPRFMAGCHYFTFAEARAHWGSADYPDQKRGNEYLRLIDFVEKEI